MVQYILVPPVRPGTIYDVWYTVRILIDFWSKMSKKMTRAAHYLHENKNAHFPVLFRHVCVILAKNENFRGKKSRGVLHSLVSRSGFWNPIDLRRENRIEVLPRKDSKFIVKYNSFLLTEAVWLGSLPRRYCARYTYKNPAKTCTYLIFINLLPFWYFYLFLGDNERLDYFISWKKPKYQRSNIRPKANSINARGRDATFETC